MTETIEAAKRLIEERLSQIEAERERLQSALDSLRSHAPTPSRASQGKSSSTSGKGHRRRRRARAPRGQREQQLLASIQANPGNSVADHARKLGVAPSQIYALTRRLSGEGKIRKAESGFEVTTETSTSG